MLGDLGPVQLAPENKSALPARSIFMVRSIAVYISAHLPSVLGPARAGRLTRPISPSRPSGNRRALLALEGRYLV